MQLDYNDPPVGMPGMIADASPKTINTGRNEDAGAVPFGMAVVSGTADDQFKLPSATGQVFKGVTVHQNRADVAALAGIGAIPIAETSPLMSAGRIWVPVENAVDDGMPAFYRHTANGGNTQLGKFRSDNDGVQQVITVTPNPVNSAIYGLIISTPGRTFRFAITADGSATATEINDAFRTAMQANAAFNALIASTGTTTLILTAVDKGVVFDVVSDGSAGPYTSITTTTAASTRADRAGRSVFRTSTAGAGLAILELNQP